MKSVRLSSRDFEAITKMTSRLQIVTFLALLSALDNGRVTEYIELLQKEVGYSRGTIIQVLEMLLLDGHIEKIGGSNAPLGECPLRITTRKKK